eukprot:4151912-Pleurochrysis_carterae.AAC.1
MVSSVVYSGSAASEVTGGEGASVAVPCGDDVGRVVCASPGNSVSMKRACGDTYTRFEFGSYHM